MRADRRVAALPGCFPVVAFLLLAAASPARAETTERADDSAMRLEIAYQGSFLRLRLMKSVVALSADDARYSMAVGFRTAGLAGFFKKSLVEAKVSGRRASTGLQPLAYDHDETTGKKRRTVSIRRDGEQVTLSVAPPFGDLGQPPASEAQKREALDPLSALAALALDQTEDPCARTIPVFDSRLRYDLVAEPLGRETVRVRGYDGPAFKCRVLYVPRAGFDPDDLDSDIYDTPFTIWLADLGDVRPVVRVKALYRGAGVPFSVEVEATRIERRS